MTSTPTAWTWWSSSWSSRTSSVVKITDEEAQTLTTVGAAVDFIAARV